MTSAALAGTPAPPDPAPQPAQHKHQVAVLTHDCMRKMMTVDKVISYNKAQKTCRDQIQKPAGKPPSGAP